MALRAKQHAFIHAYLSHWNATKAAIDAGYAERSAASIGSENLRKPEIQAAIQARLAELTMSADEVLVRISDHARGDMSDFLTIAEEDVVIEQHINGVLTTTETVRRPVARFDLEKAEKAGKLHLIKSYSLTDKGLRAELYDAHAALSLLAKIHGLLIDRTETTIDFIGDAAESLDRKLVSGMADESPTDVSREPEQT